jgi:hypothetical protein
VFGRFSLKRQGAEETTVVTGENTVTTAGEVALYLR